MTQHWSRRRFVPAVASPLQAWAHHKTARDCALRAIGAIWGPTPQHKTHAPPDGTDSRACKAPLALVLASRNGGVQKPRGRSRMTKVIALLGTRALRTTQPSFALTVPAQSPRQSRKAGTQRPRRIAGALAVANSFVQRGTTAKEDYATRARLAAGATPRDFRHTCVMVLAMLDTFARGMPTPLSKERQTPGRLASRPTRDPPAKKCVDWKSSRASHPPRSIVRRGHQRAESSMIGTTRLRAAMQCTRFTDRHRSNARTTFSASLPTASGGPNWSSSAAVGAGLPTIALKSGFPLKTYPTTGGLSECECAESPIPRAWRCAL